MRHVYILRCKDNTLYTGITNDIEKRVFDHNNSKCGARYTKSRRQVKLVRSKKAKNRNEAAKLEYAIKRLSREKKEDIVKGKVIRKKNPA